MPETRCISPAPAALDRYPEASPAMSVNSIASFFDLAAGTLALRLARNASRATADDDDAAFCE
jgi:hypothetical protein